MSAYISIDRAQEQDPLTALSVGVEGRWIQLRLGVPLSHLRRHSSDLLNVKEWFVAD